MKLVIRSMLAISCMALLVSGAPGAESAVTVTQVGTPTWEPTDVHLFSASIGSPPNFFVAQSEVLTILPPPAWAADSIIGIRPDQPLSPPYTNLVANGLSATGFREDTVFTPAEFSGGGAVWLMWLIVPAAGASTGSSPDYASGPIIPNSLCPITQTGVTTRNGIVFDTAWNGFIPALTDLSPAINADGWSRIAQFNAEAPEVASTATAPRSPRPNLIVDDGGGGGGGGGAPNVNGFYHEEFTELDASSNGWIIAADYQVSDHDLAVTSIKAPKTIALSATKPSQTKFVTVMIQNRGTHAETITNLTDLVTLEVHSLTNSCPDLTPVLLTGPPQKALPLVLKTMGSLKVVFSVTYSTNCVPDAAKNLSTAAHADYRYTAHVNAAGIDGLDDIHTANDDCPRNPDGSLVDKGCGSKKPDKTLGGDVLTDVVVK